MFNQKVKIVILFLLIIFTIVGGYTLYKRLAINKQSFDVEIYDYLAPSGIEVININKSYNVDDILILYPSIRDLMSIVGDHYSLPLVVSIYENQKSLLMTKVSSQEFNDIKKELESRMLSNFPTKSIKYKDVDVFLYPVSENQFVVYSFHNGIFAVSKNLKLIEDFIDTDPHNSFFSGLNSNEDLKVHIEQILASETVQLFKKTDNYFLALDYSRNNDSILLDGFISVWDSRITSDSVNLDFGVLPYQFNLPDSLCLDSCFISDDSIFPRLKLFLNKRF